MPWPSDAPADVLVELLHPIKERAYDLLRLQPDDRVLDVGCGAAVDTLPLAATVGSSGSVVGLDIDRAVVAEADARVRAAGFTGLVTHRHGDALKLPFADDSFDAGRCDMVLSHLTDPARALSELSRVVRPGGWIVAIDLDLSTASRDTTEVEAEWRLRRAAADRLPHGYAGRQVGGWLRSIGLEEIELHPITLALSDAALWDALLGIEAVERSAQASGRMAPDALRRLNADIDRRIAFGTFLGYLTLTLAAGRVPAPF